MTQKEIIKEAEITMKAILVMARSPIVTQRGMILIKKFLAKVNEKPKAKKKETE